MAYKRSQIEDAICRSSDAKVGARSKILVRIKRLLDIDRKLKRKGRSRGQRIGGYAFFSEEAPGKGAEVMFQDYEAFALELALQFLDQGVPQQNVVEVLRGLRPALQAEHKRIVSLPFKRFIGWDGSSPPAMISNDPVFVVVGRFKSQHAVRTKSGMTAEILRGGGALWNYFLATQGKALTTAEITLTAHALQSNLIITNPRNRGRG